MRTPLLLASLVALPLAAAAETAVPRKPAPWETEVYGKLGATVHLPGGSAPPQQGALLAAGVPRVRTDVFAKGLEDPELLTFKDGGWDVLGIMINEHGDEGRALYAEFDRDPEAFIDRYVKALPWIQSWEFGNEPDGFIGMSAQEYVGHLKKAYDVFARKYPQLTLVSAAPVGNKSGADYLRSMIKAGLLTMPNVVVGVHIYDANPRRFDQMRGRRVWITESGADWNQQSYYWSTMIKDIDSVLKPERVYWYANWTGQAAPGSGDGWTSIDPATGKVTGSSLYDRIVSFNAGADAAGR